MLAKTDRNNSFATLGRFDVVDIVEAAKPKKWIPLDEVNHFSLQVRQTPVVPQRETRS
jgi:uncharacterized protein with GYD domain